MATKDIKRLEDFIRVLDTRVKELDKEARSWYNALRSTAAENKAWLKGNIELCDKGISRLNDDQYKYSQRIAALEGEVKRLKSSRFSFKAYLSRLFNALRNKP